MARYFGLFSTFVICALPILAGAQSASSLPVAQTLDIATSEAVVPGAVVRFVEERDEYQLTSRRDDTTVYGVVAERPAVVFVTSSTSAPVVSNGTTLVRVTVDGAPIERGDLLVSATSTGVATRATLADEGVFAAALEAIEQDGMIQATIGVERAQALQEQRRAQQEAAADSRTMVSTMRAVVAGVVALGALGFLLYSFRSIMTGGVVSIGRNPRARGTVILVSIGSMVLALVVVGFIVFVAVGILVLPI